MHNHVSNDLPQEPYRVLLVDDEPLILLIVGDFLAEITPSVTKVKNASEALSALDESEFDLVITDRCMPGTDGLTLCRLVKQTRPNLKVILISGALLNSPSPSNGGPDTFLAKPFTRTELLETIRQTMTLTEA